MQLTCRIKCIVSNMFESKYQCRDYVVHIIHGYLNSYFWGYSVSRGNKHLFWRRTGRKREGIMGKRTLLIWLFHSAFIYLERLDQFIDSCAVLGHTTGRLPLIWSNEPSMEDEF